jgi:pantoate--beta-alanine ligase
MTLSPDSRTGPEILRTLASLRAKIAEWRTEGARIAVVPTMGALHAGHLSLVTEAATRADRIIVTLFINPRQFDNEADLAAYPRTEKQDAAKLAGTAADILYVPNADEMYPPGFATRVAVDRLGEGLCGAHRPGHFEGMATVVAKLFTQTAADVAMFGEKDFQQLRIVQRMAADLDLPIEVVGCPTMREPSGLAMSSRNARLSDKSRTAAAALWRILTQCGVQLSDGVRDGSILERGQHDMLSAGFQSVEYLELRASDDLQPLDRPTKPARLLVAAWIDGVRLIDNVAVCSLAEAAKRFRL